MNTYKRTDFFIFSDIIKLIENKAHLNKDTIKEIIILKSILNKGLSDKLKLYFPNIVKINKYKKYESNIINSNWFAEFYSRDGCFLISIYKNSNYKSGFSVTLRLLIGQHNKDQFLIRNFVSLFESGTVYTRKNKNFTLFILSNFKVIYDKIIPFFKRNEILGIKSLDFQDFCLAAELINKKAHLTSEGLNEIQIIKSRMNKARYKKWCITN